MTSIAATADRTEVAHSLGSIVRTSWFKKLGGTVLLAVFTGLVLPAALDKAGRVVQDRQRERDLKVSMSEGIVQPLTAAVTRAGLFAAGLLPAAGSGALPYPTVLEEWLAASSKAGAQVATYVDTGGAINERIRNEWKPLFEAVTDYLRISTDVEQVDPRAGLNRIRERLDDFYPIQASGVDWAALQGPKTAAGWYDRFQDLGYQLLAARDVLLGDIRSARLAGFTRHLLDF